jgi:hypothetical protein
MTMITSIVSIFLTLIGFNVSRIEQQKLIVFSECNYKSNLYIR